MKRAEIHRRPRYTVQRITKDDRLYGKRHYSYDGNETLCGKDFNGDGSYFILTNDFDGEADCGLCKEELRYNLVEQRQ